MATIQGIYIALFGRPADPAGLEFFNEATNNGANLTAIGDLAATAEYQDRFAGMSNTQIITAIYQSLFARAPEAAGLEFFAAALENGTLNINNIAIAILDGAQGADKSIIDNKLVAADRFTDALDTATERQAYTGDAAADAGRAYLTPVTAAASSIPSATATDAAIAKIVAGPAVPGVTIQLTAGVDIVSPTAADPAMQSTAGDDKIVGGANWDAANDLIDGGAGTDTFSASVAAATTVVTDGLKNVENLFIKSTNAAGAVNVENAKQASQIWNDASGFALSVTNIAAGTTVGLKGAVNGTTFALKDATGTSDSMTVALDGASNAAGTTTIVGVETISLATQNAASAVNLTIAATKTLNVSGDKAATITLADATALETLDASGNSGSVKVDVTGANALKTVSGSSAADTITVDQAGNTANLSVSGNAGADTLIVNAGASAFTLTLTGGEGADTFRFADFNNVANAAKAEFAKSLVTITDFAAGSDTIDLKGVPFVAGGVRDILTGTELENIAAADSLFDAVTLAAGFTGDNMVSLFVYGGDTYIFNQNDAGNTFTAGDGLIKVAGISDLSDFTATNLLFLTA